MATPKAPYLSLDSSSQSVVTPVPRRDLHALRSGHASVQSSPKLLPAAWQPCSAATPSSSACMHGAALEQTSLEHLNGSNAPPGTQAALPTVVTPKQVPPLEPPSTPQAAVFQFGSPMRSPRAVLPSPPKLLSVGRYHSQPTMPCPPLSLEELLASLPPGSKWAPPPPLAQLSPQLLLSTAPCSVRLSGSVRLRGDSITELPPGQVPPPVEPAAAPSTVPAATPPRARRAQKAKPGRPAALQVQRAGAAAACAVSAGSSTPFTSLAGLLSVQHASAPVDPSAQSVAAEMMTTPRKRARKNTAPARAAACDGEALLGGTTGAPALSHGSLHVESGCDSSALDDSFTPSKMARRE